MTVGHSPIHQYVFAQYCVTITAVIHFLGKQYMYDLHCHLLPDVDDGPATWEQTFALARCLLDEGVTTVAATPHSYGIRPNRTYDPAYIKQVVEQARIKFKAQGLPLTLVSGTEILLGDNLMARLNRGQVLCYGQSRTLLLETSAYIEPDELINAVDKLHNRGYRVVFAHPEKLEAVHDDPNVLIPLVERGLAMQVTAANLAGLNGPRQQHLCEDLLRHGLAHLIASDAHAAAGPRAPAMRAGYQAALKLVGPQAYHLVVTIPQLILNEEPLPAFKPKRVITRRN